MSSRTCRKCGVEKLLTEYHKQNTGLNGYRSVCKTCRSIAQPKEQKLKKLIEKFTEKHGQKYNYSLVELGTRDDKIKIICPHHGLFLQSIKNHHRGGCPKCSHEATAARMTKGKEQFLKEARKMYGDKYDYSLVQSGSTGSRNKIKIICQIHGEFEKTPTNFLRGQDCPKCSKEKLVKEASKKFIENAKKIHGDKYDYSQVDYVDNTTSVKLICPDHGEFWVYPASHTSKAKKTKCPECKAEERSDSIEFVEAHLKDKKMKLLDTMYPNRKYVMSMQEIKLGCEVCSHSWITKWRSIKINNNTCTVCLKYKNSHSFQEFQELANSLNCQIIKFPENPLPFVNVMNRVDYKCNFCSSIHHDVLANNLIENQRKERCACVKCASYKNSISFSDAKEMIEGHGFKVVKLPDNGPFKKIKDHHHITTECPNGHVKEHRWHNLLHSGNNLRGKLPCRECIDYEWRKMKLSDFLVPAKEKWGDRYDYSLINESNWQSSRTPVPIICHIHGTFEAQVHDFLNRKHGCPECAKIEVGKKHARTNEEYVKLLKETHPKIIPLQEYDRSQVHIKHKCLECDHEWKVQPTPLLQQKYGCPVCAMKFNALSRRRTHEEYVKLLAEANPNVIALEEYQKSDIHIMHKCLKCDNEWKTIPNCLIGQKTGCPKCNRAGFREQWTREVLEEVFGLPFPTCKPKWLKYKGQMEIDCYNEGLGLAVEYQGAQHYEPIRHFGGEESLLIRLQRDRVKCNLINEKKIVFWRFDNRKYRKLLEKEFKLAIKKEIRKKALSKYCTPEWLPASHVIRRYFTLEDK